MRYQKRECIAIVMILVLIFTLTDFNVFRVKAEGRIDITRPEETASTPDLFEITGVEDVTYSGSPVIQNITVKYDGNVMVQNVDFNCLYTNNTNAGTAKIRIVGKGNYTGYREIEFEIKKAIPDHSIYNAITGIYGDTLGDIELPKRDNGVFTWKEDLNQELGEPGEHNFHLMFTPNDTRNYEVIDDILITIEVLKRSIADSKVEGITDAVYCAQPIVYDTVVTWEDKVLVENEDYTITFDNNINAGTAWVTITGIGHYGGTKEQTFKIAKADPDFGEVEVLNAVYRDCLGDITLPSRENGTFVWEYSQSVEVGNVGITSSAIRFVPNDKANYNIIKNIPVEIKVDRKDIAKVTFSEMKQKVYNGEEQTQNIYIKDGAVKLVRGKDYTVEYQDNIDVGMAKVIITGIENYTGEQVLEFPIEKAVPKYPKFEISTAIYGQNLGDVKIIQVPEPTEAPEPTENPQATETPQVTEGPSPTVTIKKELPVEGDFYFEDDLTTSVGEVGINTFNVTFKPKDSKNYSEVKNIQLKVKVEALDMSSAQVMGVADGYVTGNEVKPEVTVKFQGEFLVYGKDYSLGYANNVYPGQAAVVVKGLGNYKGKIVTFYQVLE